MRSILEKVRGVIPRFKSSKEQKIDLQKAINKGALVEKLRTGKDWPVVDDLLRFFHDQAVQGFSQTGITPKQVERLNHRLELIRHFREETERRIQEGKTALQLLGKLKEKENV